MVGVCGFGYTEGGLSLRPVPMTVCSTPGQSVCQLTLGPPNHLPNKVIFLLGQDQESKGTHKDDIMNYVFDVQRYDTYRLILVDDFMAESDKDVVRVYTINMMEGQKLPFNITLIDLPPLGCIGEAERDMKIMLNVENFLQKKFGTTLVDSINIVASSCIDQLHILDNTYKLLHVCFDELDSITQILVTDSTSYMPLLNSLKEYNIKYTNFFIFDNESTSNDISDEESFFTSMFRYFDYHGVDDFFQELSEISPQPMSLVRHVKEGCVDINDMSRLRIVHRFSQTVGAIGGQSFRQVSLEPEYRDETTKTQVLVVGETNNKPAKTMLLVGNRSSGKTTLLTAIVNHIFGIKYHDKFRLLIDGDPLCRLRKDQNLNKTKLITSYIFNVLPNPYDTHKLVIFDTPGLKSTEDQPFNKSLIDSLSSFRRQCGIKQFDIIAYVVPAGKEKMQDSYRAVYKQLYSLMIDRGSEKLIILATQSDAKKPPAIMAMKNLGLPFVKSFKFNSHTLLTDVHLCDEVDPTYQTLCQHYWKIEQYSLSSLCAELLS